ncbi:alpha/beta fold hydrolase [Sinobaca sp. H24]|uniref:alpha/beta fold hydrolase n=1 Tax=Sinobaca sp. H24 TaxID=2923376 RepID=UPI00207A20AB|nr:alpha/beta hydrolase [Sinobaca sp. H24]
MTSLLPARCITFSHRGRGKSSAPEKGYTLEHHIADIEAVVDYLGLKNFHLMGYSRGVSYALGYAVKHSASLKGLILAEYPPEHKKMPYGWADQYLKTHWGNDLGADIMEAHVVKAIEQESAYVNFHPHLHSIKCPVLIMRGVLNESLLSKEQAEVYEDAWKECRIEVFENSGHTLKESEEEKFAETLKLFLNKNE